MPVNSLLGLSRCKHRFRDDMESFFYVVLYASLRWLPHSFSGDLAKEMRAYFDDCRESNGMIVGGNAKTLNLVDDYTFIGTFEWKNPELSHWIHTTLSLQRKQFRNKDQPIWIPEKLFSFWVLTDSSNLPMGDRFEHIIFINNEQVKDPPVPATMSLVNKNPPKKSLTINSAHTAPANAQHISSSKNDPALKKRRVQIKPGPRRQSKRQRGLEPDPVD